MCIVIGYKKIIAKKDGRVFYELHLQTSDKVDDGVAVDKIFVPSDRIENLQNLSVNSEISINYNKYGNVSSVVIE